jgi:hypothetical protein
VVVGKGEDRCQRVVFLEVLQGQGDGGWGSRCISTHQGLG